MVKVASIRAVIEAGEPEEEAAHEVRGYQDLDS
jgi:hypothetical protein